MAKKSMTPSEKQAHQNGYSKGYAAGRKRTAKEDERYRQIHPDIFEAREAFQREAFLTVLNATLISGRWETSGRSWSTGQEYVDGCWNIATIATAKAFK